MPEELPSDLDTCLSTPTTKTSEEQHTPRQAAHRNSDLRSIELYRSGPQLQPDLAKRIDYISTLVTPNRSTVSDTAFLVNM